MPTAVELAQWGIDPTWSRTIAVVDATGVARQWHLLECGPTDPIATIVCVHGNPTWSYLWRSVLQRLGDRYRVVAVDQLGMGFSERTAPRDFAARVADLTAVFAALRIEGPVVTVGHDWGGPISLGWALAAGDRLAGVVLCNTGVAVPAGRRAPWLIRLAATGPVTDLVGRRTRAFVEGTLAFSRRRLDGPARAALRAPYRGAHDRPAIAEFVADVPFGPSHPSAAAVSAVAEGLRSLRTPALVLWGALDPVFGDDFAHDLASRIPHADVHRFSGAGHLSPAEHGSADVAGVIDAWLTDHVGRSAGDLASLTHTASCIPIWAALAARAHDTTVAYADGRTGETVSFAELHERVTGIARGLAEQGVVPGDRVALLVPPSADLLAAAYGCWRAGAVTVIADRGLGVRGLGRAVRAARVDWVIGPARALAAARALRWAPGARFIAVGRAGSTAAETTLEALSRSQGAMPIEPDSSAPAAVLYTSGATGPAKGVRYRHGQLAAQRDALARTYAITSDDRLVAAFAPFALYGPALGITSTIPAVDVTHPGSLTANALAEAVEAVDASIVFASPAALANVVRTAPLTADSRLAHVRLVLSAGAPVPIATLRATAALCPSAEVHTPYGMTECLPVADIDLAALETVVACAAARGVCVGVPVAGSTVIVAPLGFDAQQPLLGEVVGVTGEVLVRAAWMSDGYDQIWRTQRDARPVDSEGLIWHRSGDVGHLDIDGRLWIEGRSVHVIHTDLGAVTPVPVEVAVEKYGGVVRSAAIGVGPVGCQQLVVVVEDPDSDDGLADATLTANLREIVARETGSRVAAVLRVCALPVDIRHNTKIDRTALATWGARVLAGDRARRPR
ncbi:MAG: alpha/beta fold hydrolase [Actinobacteria bacterium]|uniref:Unannotated protein n=1 Tax=freshwater metagenome TaxID=449393 RepID=A0A6J7AUE6_9ZZZZ|nr:alpha/beta fold hydrolase [Actinomycetota bacterium]